MHPFLIYEDNALGQEDRTRHHNGRMMAMPERLCDVSCDRFLLLAKTLVVCKVIVIQNGPSIHVIIATSFVQKHC
jgi:hypothetical protein